MKKLRGYPYIFEESPGEKFYCGCSQSNNMPYCDGSHFGTDCEPYRVFIEQKRTVSICGCGRSGNMPFCDRTHECLE